MKLSSSSFLLQQIRYWTARLSASDPGHIRLNLASRAVLSVILSIFLMTLLQHLIHQIPITAVMLAGVLGMMSTVAVNDDTEAEQRVTTLLLPFSSAIALTASAFLLQISHYFVDGLLLVIVFLALYTQQFRFRYFSICMVGFISIYFSALLHMKPAQLPWFYIGIGVGVSMTLLVKFILFRDRPTRTLKRSMASFHIQINLTLLLIIEMIEDNAWNQARLKQLQRNIVKLSEYARMVSGQFDSADPGDLWPGIQTRQLRLYIFDATMLMQTLFPAIRKLKELHALENSVVRHSLLKLMRCFRNASVLKGDFDQSHLAETRKAADELKQHLRRWRSEGEEFIDWLYLLRRISSIADHIIDEIDTIQKSRLQPGAEEEPPEQDQRKEENTDNNQKQKKAGLQPETKKAIQAVSAGVISILLGYLLTPTHQYWILLSGFVVFFGTESAGNTVVKAFNRFAGTFFGAIAGFGIDHVLSGVPFLEIPFIFLCVFMGFYLIPISYALMIFWITMLLAMMYNLLLGGISESLLASRVIDTFIGAGLGALATTFLLPRKTIDKVRETSVAFLSLLKENVGVHLDKFTGTQTRESHAHQAFELDERLQQVKDDAKPVTRGPNYVRRSEIEHRITVLTAMNYYAKHLVASTDHSGQMKLNPALLKNLEHVKMRVSENIDTLCHLLEEKENKNCTVWDLANQRELIERSPDTPGDHPVQMKLIYDLYYVWRINKAVLSLSRDLGAQVQPDPIDYVKKERPLAGN